MASRGRGRRGRPRGASQAPPFFDQEAFIEAMGAAIATATQADAARVQGGASNLRRVQGTSSSDVHRRRGPDGSRPLVPSD